MSFLQDFDAFNKHAPIAATNLLFSWLEDDELRPALLAELAAHRPVLAFQTRAGSEDSPALVEPDPDLLRATPAGNNGWDDVAGGYGLAMTTGALKRVPKRRHAYLVTGQANIEQVLDDLSNEPYADIGDGDFVLGLDGDLHDVHRTILEHTLKPIAQKDPKAFVQEVHFVSWLAAKNAMVRPRKMEQFDLARDVAEQGALRFVAGYFGFPDTEHVLLQESMRMTLHSMVYQMFGRHFVTDPAAIFRGKQGMAALSTLVGELLDQAGRDSIRSRLVNAVREEGTQGAVSVLRQIGESILAQPQVEQMRNVFEEVHGGNPSLGVVVTQLAQGLAQTDATTASMQAGEVGADSSWVLVAASQLDALVNFGFVRRLLLSNELTLGGRGKLENMLIELAEEREARDENLVPRKFGLLPERGLVSQLESDRLYVRKTVIERLADEETEQYGLDVATSIVGSIAGLVGNITAAVCITMNELLKDPEKMIEARAIAKLPDSLDSDRFEWAFEGGKALCPYVEEAMRLYPPAVVIPRRVANQPYTIQGVELPVGADVIIPLGSATRDLPESENPDEFDLNRDNSKLLVFGQREESEHSHRCLGEFITAPLVAHVVRQLLALDGLSTTISDDGVTENRLKKQWGYICDSFPVTHNRGANLKQRPLNVVMKVRAPVPEHAEALKKLIKHGAPLIENLLSQSNIVHFARFVFFNNDTELGLFTTYDGDFESYIRFFAEAAGPIFDKIFEHIEDPPPSPVRNNPTAFVEHIRRYDIPPVGDYFFSATPTEKVDPGPVA